MIDRLLDSPEFGTHAARYWRNVIRFHATNQIFQRAGVAALSTLEHWLAGQFNANAPWDEIADATDRRRPAIAAKTGRRHFHLAHADQVRIPPVEVAGEVSRIFLGVQIPCAECHDHPNDPWTREQFHEFAAFFAGTRARPNGQPVRSEIGFTVIDRRAGPATRCPTWRTRAIDPRRAGVLPGESLRPTAVDIPANLGGAVRRSVAASWSPARTTPGSPGRSSTGSGTS